MCDLVEKAHCNPGKRGCAQVSLGNKSATTGSIRGGEGTVIRGEKAPLKEQGGEWDVFVGYEIPVSPLPDFACCRSGRASGTPLPLVQSLSSRHVSKKKTRRTGLSPHLLPCPPLLPQPETKIELSYLQYTESS